MSWACALHDKAIEQVAIKCVVCLHTLLCWPQCWVPKNKCDRVNAASPIYDNKSDHLPERLGADEILDAAQARSLCLWTIEWWPGIEHIFIHSQNVDNSKLRRIHMPRAQAHCLLANVRIFCWPHTKTTYLCAKQGDSISSPATLWNLLSVRIFCRRTEFRWTGKIVSDSTMIEVRKFCLKANFNSHCCGGVLWCATAKMFYPFHCSVLLVCESQYYGSSTSRILYVNGTFITPVPTIFAPTGEWVKANGFSLVAAILFGGQFRKSILTLLLGFLCAKMATQVRVPTVRRSLE